MLIHLKNTFRETSSIIFGQVFGCHGLAKLTHKIDHPIPSLSSFHLVDLGYSSYPGPILFPTTLYMNVLSSVVLCSGQSYSFWCLAWSLEDFSSAQFSHSVVSDSLQPHESQHARPPCPSPSPGVHSNSRPSSWWCHPAISSSVVPFSSCPNPSQHQSLFQWVNSSHEMAKVLEFQL